MAPLPCYGRLCECRSAWCGWAEAALWQTWRDALGKSGTTRGADWDIHDGMIGMIMDDWDGVESKVESWYCHDIAIDIHWWLSGGTINLQMEMDIFSRVESYGLYGSFFCSGHTGMGPEFEDVFPAPSWGVSRIASLITTGLCLHRRPAAALWNAGSWKPVTMSSACHESSFINSSWCFRIGACSQDEFIMSLFLILLAALIWRRWQALEREAVTTHSHHSLSSLWEF